LRNGSAGSATFIRLTSPVKISFFAKTFSLRAGRFFF
jgi:hypothetical protein